MADIYKRLSEEERAILRDFPKLTKEELSGINTMFRHYVFYKTERGGRRLWTSCCHKESVFYPAKQRTETEEHRAFISARHNDKICCPYCGREAALKGKNIKKSWLLETKNIVILNNINGALFAQAYKVRKEYTDAALHRTPEFLCYAAYHFTIGRAIMFFQKWDNSWSCIAEQGKIGRQIAIKEPFPRNGSFGSGYEDYYIINPEALAESGLKYCQYDKWEPDMPGEKQKSSMIRYLTLYCIYPHATEMLIKNNMRRVVEDFIFYRKKNAAAIKWSERDPRRAFGLTAEELRQFLTVPDRDVGYVSAYKALKKAGLKSSFEDIRALETALGYRSEGFKFIKNCTRFKTPPQKLLKYLDRFTGGCSAGGYRSSCDSYGHWKDYIDAADKIGYDLTAHTVAFPKNLGEAHDAATAELNRRLRAQKEAKTARQKEKEAALLKNREKKYAWEQDGYLIRPAQDSQEIISEGKALSHCVGGYADRHMRGVLTILFLRRASEPNIPLITIELDKKGCLIQAHGYKNERVKGKRIAPDPREAYKFILDPWLDWIKSGSKRDKQGNPITIQKKKEVGAA